MQARARAALKPAAMLLAAAVVTAGCGSSPSRNSVHHKTTPPLSGTGGPGKPQPPHQSNTVPTTTHDSSLTPSQKAVAASVNMRLSDFPSGWSLLKSGQSSGLSGFPPCIAAAHIAMAGPSYGHPLQSASAGSPPAPVAGSPGGATGTPPGSGSPAGGQAGLPETFYVADSSVSFASSAAAASGVIAYLRSPAGLKCVEETTTGKVKAVVTRQVLAVKGTSQLASFDVVMSSPPLVGEGYMAFFSSGSEVVEGTFFAVGGTFPTQVESSVVGNMAARASK